MGKNKIPSMVKVVKELEEYWPEGQPNWWYGPPTRDAFNVAQWFLLYTPRSVLIRLAGG